MTIGLMRACLTAGALLLAAAAGGCSGGEGDKDAAPPGEAPVPIPHGFGDYCTHIAHECGADLFCVRDPVEQVGFCSEYCSNKGARCTNAPAGSYAECTLTIASSGKLACLFLCGGSYRCPTSMTCDTGLPVGGGLYRCQP